MRPVSLLRSEKYGVWLDTVQNYRVVHCVLYGTEQGGNAGLGSEFGV